MFRETRLKSAHWSTKTQLTVLIQIDRTRRNATGMKRSLDNRDNVDENAVLFCCLASLLFGLDELQRVIMIEIFRSSQFLKTPPMVVAAEGEENAKQKRRRLSEKRMSHKQNSAKPGFFDLPTELRLTIYEHFLTASHEEARQSDRFVPLTFEEYRRCFNGAEGRGWEPSVRRAYEEYLKNLEHDVDHRENIVKCTRSPTWDAYWRSVRDAQLISQQFRDELVPPWASRHEFKVSIYPSSPFTDEKGIYLSAAIRAVCVGIHSFFDQLGDLTRRENTGVRFLWEMTGPNEYKQPNKKKRTRAEMAAKIIRLVGKDFNSYLRSIADVHPELKIEIELYMITKISHDTETHLKQLITLHQIASESPLAADTTAWVSSESPLLAKFVTPGVVSWGGPMAWHVYDGI